MTVRDLLNKLGIPQYITCFEEHDIDENLLPTLTDHDLKELGVHSLGHRKRILAAIDENIRRPAKPGSVSGIIPEEHVAGRRQVTVLFADISGFTNIAADNDPEIVNDILRNFFNTVDSLVSHYGGTVDKHIGDCVMAVFGVRHAHSNDEERAVRCALDIHRGLAELSDELKWPLRAHVGVSSGEVVVENFDGGSHHEIAITGESVNLAARLVEQAGPGETSISDEVYSGLKDLAECESQGEVEIRGFPQKVRIWRLISIRKETPRVRPLVGREEELNALRNVLLRSVATGKGQAIYLCGEPGIGKTKMLSALHQEADQLSFSWHGSLVLEFGTAEGHDAIRTIVRNLVVGNGRGGAITLSQAVTQSVRSGLVDASDRIFLHGLLGLPFENEERSVYEAVPVSERERRKREMLSKLIANICRIKSLVISIEDVHWGGSDLFDYIDVLFGCVAQHRLVLVLTAREDSDFLDKSAAAALREKCEVVELGPLSDQNARKMADIFAISSVKYVEGCIARAKGNPLFLEQLLCAGQPGSIQSIVQDRLKHLDKIDREVIEIAAVLGQRFALEEVRNISDQANYDCARLVHAGLIKRYGDSYLFEHDLIRDGVYQTLDSKKLQELHISAAKWYEKTDPALRAEHLERAKSPLAAEAFADAAQIYFDKFNFTRAMSLAQSGLELAQGNHLLFRLYSLIGNVERELGDGTASLAKFEQALEVASSDHEHAQALIGKVAAMRLIDQIDEAFEILDLAQEYAERADEPRELCMVHYYRGGLYFPRGEHLLCLEEHSFSLRYAGSDFPELQALALSGMGDAYYATGRMRTAAEVFGRCLTLCNDFNLMHIKAANQFMLGTVRIYLNETQMALHDALESIRVAGHVINRRAEIVARLTASWIYLSLFDLDNAAEEARTGIDLARSIGAKRFEPFLSECLARVQFSRGNEEEALEIIESAIARNRELDGMRFIGPWLLATYALTVKDDAKRMAALEEGGELLEGGCVGHNYFRFSQIGIDACLNAGDWSTVELLADRLAKYTEGEPVPWSEFVIQRGRTIAAYRQGNRSAEVIDELKRLRKVAKDASLVDAARLIEECVSEAQRSN